ncbi:YlqD family protein [Candidatus Saganbacteria bacterium]|uniref:YlqD family protein n=1 Tax=Candidatus Saganbacteria bacterium TaxID=2575572 RepID=A0A9D6YXE9_UNCSA|nr:YlqD family protein [Candidatus Saganbacteria bacterium]
MTEKVIELKRVVMVKAIVTEAFKQNLTKELERAVANLDTQMTQMEGQSKNYLEDLKKKGLMQKAAAFKHQLDEERARQTAARSDLLMKIEEAKRLQLGSEFVQGPLEGPVDLGIGDNLYKKVGGAEIIVKDGIVQEIRGV